MNKIKVLIIALVLCFSVFLLTPNKASAYSSKEYVISTPPFNMENDGEYIDFEYINYYVTYYEEIDLYYLRFIEIKVQEIDDVFTFDYDDYLPSGIKYLGVYLCPIGDYGNNVYSMYFDLVCRIDTNTYDTTIESSFGQLDGFTHYQADAFGSIFYTSMVGIDSQYNLGYSDGSKDAYTNAYNKGYQEGLKTADNDFNALFWGIADVPSQVLFSVLSFEIFGVNAFSILFSILTVLLIAWLIKKFVA